MKDKLSVEEIMRMFSVSQMQARRLYDARCED